MKVIHCVLGMLALAATATASAVPTTYGFNTAAGGGSTWVSTFGGANASSGTNYGNALTYNALSGPADKVTITAWGSTGNGGGVTGTIQSAFLNNAYSTGGKKELAITSRSTTGTTAATNGDSTGANNELTDWAPNTSSNQHAIDNVGAYEALMFSFESAVRLSDVSIGFPSSGSTLDSDATVLVYTGSGAPPSFSARTMADLVGSDGWAIAGNLLDLKTTGTGSLSPLIQSSKYWMVGAYMNIGSNATSNFTGKDTNPDFIKVNGFTAIRAVPEPGSVALFGVAAVALLVARRRKVRKG